MIDREETEETRFSDLLFGVRRSVRYHNRRRAFFDRLHHWTTGFTVILSSATFASLIGESTKLALVLSVFALVLSSLDLVIGYAEASRLHWDLARRFIGLEKEMELCVSADDVAIRRFTAQRLEIEAEEPPVLRVLDTLCHNELMRAMGHERKDFKSVSTVQKFFADWFDCNQEKIA